MDIKEYSRIIDEFAWHGNGDVFQIAKAAKALGRNYMDDITDAKRQVVESKDKTIFDYITENQDTGE